MTIRPAFALTVLALPCLLTACSGNGTSTQEATVKPEDDPLEATDRDTAREEPAASPDATVASPAAARTTRGDAPFWPRFHGPNGDNMSSDTGLLKEWPKDGPPLEWTAEGIGFGYSGVSMAAGLIYTTGNKDKKTVISAIDLDGNIQWQVKNGPAWTGEYEGTRGTPTIDGDRLYHQSPLGNIVCLDAEKSTRIWGTNSLETFQSDNIRWALAESLLIDGDRVICCPGGKKVSVAALDKMTGKTVWAAEGTGDKTSYASATLAEHEGLRMILTMNAKALIGVNADTGQLLFRHPFETQYDINALKPIFHDGHVFISGGYNTTGSELLKVTVDGQNVSVEKVWGSRELDNQHGGVLLIDGHLYGAAHASNRGKWVCLEWNTGKMKWAEKGVGMGSLTYADGMLYLLSEQRHDVGLAHATPENFALVSQFRLPSGGSGKSWAHPVVCGGRLYLRHADRLFAYNVKAGG